MLTDPSALLLINLVLVALGVPLEQQIAPPLFNGSTHENCGMSRGQDTEHKTREFSLSERASRSTKDLHVKLGSSQMYKW